MNRLMGKPVTGAPVAGRGRPVTGFGIGELPVQEGGTISLIKSADSYLVPPTFGVTYSLLFRNNTGSTITNIVITDDIDDAKSTYVNASGTTDQGSVTVNTGFIEVTIPSLADGEVANISYEATADSVGNIINTATYTYTEGDPGSSNPVTVVCDVLPSFSIVKSSVPTDFLNPSDPVNYQAVITNNGGQAVGCVYKDPVETTKVDFATNSVITTKGTVESGNGPLDTEVRVQIGSMANGESVTITYQVLVEAGVTVPTTLTNQATVSADNAIPENSNQVVLPIYAVPTYSPTKVADNITKYEGDRISYDVQIDTTGNTPTKNLVGVDDLHPNVTLDHTQTTTSVGTIVSGDNPGDSSIQIDFGDVAADTIINVHYEVVIDDPWTGTINNTMDFTADNRSSFSTNNVAVTVLQAVPVMGTVKGADQSSVLPGALINYTIDITNTGQRDALSVKFRDLISDQNLTLVPSSVIASGGTIIQDQTQVEVDYTSIAEQGGTAQITYQANIENPFSGGLPGSVANFGTLSGSNFNQQNSNTITIDVTAAPEPAWDLLKSVDVSTIDVGDTVHFTLRAENTGNATATNIVLEDVVPANFGNIRNETTTAGSVGVVGNTVTANITSGTAGTVITVEFDADAVSSGTPANFFTANCDEIGQATSNSTVFNISDTYSATVVKSSNVVGDANPDDTVTYTVDLTKTGSGNITSVVLADEISDADLTLVNGSATTDQGSVTQDDTRVEINVGTLGATPVQITYQALINAGMTVPGTVSNFATLTSTQIASQNSNTVDVSVVDGTIGDVDITNQVMLNPSFETDVLAPGETTPGSCANWSGIYARNPDDGIGVVDGVNTGRLLASTSPPAGTNTNASTTYQFQPGTAYKVTWSTRRATPSGTESRSTILNWIGLSTVTAPVYRTYPVTDGVGVNAWGKSARILTTDTPINELRTQARAIYNVETYHDNFKVEELAEFHPALLGASYIYCSDDTVFNVEGTRGSRTPGALSKGIAVSDGFGELDTCVAITVAKSPLQQADGSLLFDGIGNILINEASTKTTKPVSTTGVSHVFRFNLNSASPAGGLWIWNGPNVDRLYIYKPTGFEMGLRTNNVSHPERISIPTDVPCIFKVFVSQTSGQSYMQVDGGTKVFLASTTYFNTKFSTLGTSGSTAAAALKFWGMCSYPEDDPGDYASVVGWLNNLEI